MDRAKLEPLTVRLRVLRADHPATPTHLSRKITEKGIQITSLPDRPGPQLSGGVLWEMYKWRIVAISCCVASYFNLRHVNDYRSYLIKGRTPLIETQNNVRNKSTIVFQKCNLNNRKSLLRRSFSRGICPQTPSYAHPALWMAPRSLKNLTLLLVLPKIIKPRKSVQLRRS